MLQIPKAMPSPVMSVCGHRPINVLNLVEIVDIMSKEEVKIPYTREPLTDDQHAMNDIIRLLPKLKTLNTILKKEMRTLENYVKKITGEKDLSDDWVRAREALVKRPLILTLLEDHAIQLLSNKPKEFIPFCQKAGVDCNFRFENHDEFLNHAEYFTCFKMDIFGNAKQGIAHHEAISQGIQNGHTFIFLTGTGMIPKKEGKILNIPGNYISYETPCAYMCRSKQLIVVSISFIQRKMNRTLKISRFTCILSGCTVWQIIFSMQKKFSITFIF